MREPSKRDIAAYRAGQRARLAGWCSASVRFWEDAIYGHYVDPDGLDLAVLAESGHTATAFFECGIEGHEMPRWVTGERYGKIPAGGVSRNWAADSAERGLSIMRLDGTPEPMGPVGNADIYRSLFSGPLVRVAGWLLPWTGSDGEPLLAGAEYAGEVL